MEEEKFVFRKLTLEEIKKKESAVKIYIYFRLFIRESYKI
jgi:hypothetical protein